MKYSLIFKVAPLFQLLHKTGYVRETQDMGEWWMRLGCPQKRWVNEVGLPTKEMDEWDWAVHKRDEWMRLGCPQKKWVNEVGLPTKEMGEWGWATHTRDGWMRLGHLHQIWVNEVTEIVNISYIKTVLSRALASLWNHKVPHEGNMTRENKNQCSAFVVIRICWMFLLITIFI